MRVRWESDDGHVGRHPFIEGEQCHCTICKKKKSDGNPPNYPQNAVMSTILARLPHCLSGKVSHHA